MTTVKKTLRYNVVSFRITDAEIEGLRRICKLSRKRMSDLMRDALLSYKNDLLQFKAGLSKEIN